MRGEDGEHSGGHLRFWPPPEANGREMDDRWDLQVRFVICLFLGRSALHDMTVPYPIA